ncbi:NYN domain-containing protein [uncultured Corynebacterium sp.]|uniref:NYN domain-containing protein n=1 Tax=uncultured Corynebacterium sp. TaxID=159447 RepID=UPI0025F47883|nr:NYN domain-containing protein [uncultured Corynebacterium sp.]
MTTRKLLLVWDAPNMDMGLGAILGGRPTAAFRPRFDAIGRWTVREAWDLDAQPHAAVFTNVTPGGADVIRPWVEAIRNVGFAVFAKPKVHDDTDVDSDMLDYIAENRDELAGLVVASADGQNFQETLEELADEGVPVTVVGFQEHTSWAVTHPVIDFMDLEDIDGVFREPLPRVNLDNLPDGGAWLQPFRPLSALLDER